MTNEQLLNWFTHHSPNEADVLAYGVIRGAGLALAEAIVTNTPASADQTAAIRKVREAVAAANMARACGGK